MADNNKNPRRTIWLSETEPLSHYDIWLSKNQHLNSEGEPISDNGVLRPCDYIFKVWDCDNWYPVVGLNSTAVNKINTVLNTSYTSVYNGETIESYSYREFHLPLFTNPGASPLELFDGGTVGDVLKKYVTDTEWQLIFEGDNTTNIINKNLKPAAYEYLGGIWADTFTINEIFPDVQGYLSPTSDLITESNNWLALAKYKLDNDVLERKDYNLYVSAKDMLNAINYYQTDNPDAPSFDLWLAEENRIGGIKARRIFRANEQLLAEVGFMDDNEGDPTYGKLFVNPQDIVTGGIKLATLWEIGGILAETFDDVDIEKLVLVKFGTDNTAHRKYGLLFVNPEEIVENTFNDPSFISDLLWEAFENSPSIKKNWTYPYDPTAAQKPRFSLYGTNDPRNWGKFLRLKTADEIQALPQALLNGEIYDETSNFLEWVDISEYLGITGGTAIEIADGKINLNYNHHGLSVIDNTLTLQSATVSSLGGIIVGSGLSIDGLGVLSASTSLQLNIEAGTGINVIPNDNTRTISINTYGGNAGDFLSIIDTNTVGWRTISPSTPTTYTGDIGITVDDTDDIIKIDIGTGNNNKYLKVNEDGDDVEWGGVLGEVEPGYGIAIDTASNKISQNVGLADAPSITVYGENRNLEITAGGDNNDSITLSLTDTNDNNNHLEPLVRLYQYLDLSGYSWDSYTFSSIPTNSNPIYLIIEPKSYEDVTLAPGMKYIGDYTTMTNPCLVTIQFGIVKFEEISEVSSGL